MKRNNAACFSLVAHAPVNAVPATQTVNEDTPLSVFGSQLSRPTASAVSDFDNTPLSVTLTVTNGTLTLSRTDNLAFLVGANGSAAFQISGSQADLNAALNGLRFDPTPNFNSAGDPAQGRHADYHHQRWRAQRSGRDCDHCRAGQRCANRR